MSEQPFRTRFLLPHDHGSEPASIAASSGILHVEPDLATQALAIFDVIRIGHTECFQFWLFWNLTDKTVPIGLRFKP